MTEQNEVLKLRFNLFQEGRKYTGHHRKYILENARAVCYAPATREGIRLREKLGYLGHGRREIAGKVRIGEVEVVTLPDGSKLTLENVPSNVTTLFEIDEQGNVSHNQEILASQPGKIVSSLNKSRVGGFSWAMGGRDGGRHGATRVSTFEGFDYVTNPGFSDNRGYVLESAEAKDMILESICEAAGISDQAAEAYLQNWAASAQFYAEQLEHRLEQAAIFESDQAETIANQEAELQALKAQAEQRKKLIAECANASKIVIPNQVADALISMADENDFHTLIGFFESAGRANLSRYPLPGSSADPLLLPAHKGKPATPEYGRAAAAIDFEDSNRLLKK